MRHLPLHFSQHSGPIMSYDRRSSLLMFLTGALIMLGSIGAVATIVGSRPATAGSSNALAASTCIDCATIINIRTVILEVPGNPLTTLVKPTDPPREYHITVRHDDGTRKTISQAQNRWQTGDRVRLIDGRLLAIDAG